MSNEVLPVIVHQFEIVPDNYLCVGIAGREDAPGPVAITSVKLSVNCREIELSRDMSIEPGKSSGFGVTLEDGIPDDAEVQLILEIDSRRWAVVKYPINDPQNRVIVVEESRPGHQTIRVQAEGGGVGRVVEQPNEDRTYRDRELRLADLPFNNMVGCVFEGVTFHGPGVMALHRSITMNDITFVNLPRPDHIEDVFWPVEPGRPFIGAVGFENCEFHRCRFEGVGIACLPHVRKQMIRSYKP